MKPAFQVHECVLFGKPYLWFRGGGRWRLQPDYHAPFIMPRYTKRVHDTYLRGNK
jgi:hypothetical protein